MNDQNDSISILIVDDNEEKLISLEAVVGDMGLNIVRAMSGRECLRHLLERDFAVILMDVNMPGMDGFETASLIRQRRSCEDTPIIFITAYGDEPYVMRGYATGAVDYILTPIIPEVLRTKVGVFVELFRKNMEVRRQAEHLQDRANQLAVLASQLIDAEQRERRRIARMLHDNLQQLLVAAKLRNGALMRHAEGAVSEPAANIDDLLQQSIDASRSLTLELSPPILYDCGLGPAVRWLAGHMQDQHGLTVEVEAEASADFAMENLRAFAFQAIRELLFNIVKHAQTHRAKMTLSRQQDNYVQLMLEDDGIGFDPAARASQNGRSEHFGLFSIRERVQLMNGRFEIHSAPGAGTKIILAMVDRVERRDTPSAESPRRRHVKSQYTHKTPDDDTVTRVLLVDDHETMRSGLAMLLENESDIAVVGEAADGISAIELANQLQPDVIIMDVSMPGLNGVDTTRQIKHAMQNVRIIGLSMHSQADMANHMKQAGASEYLTKGAPPSALIEAIRRVRQPSALVRMQPTPS